MTKFILAVLMTVAAINVSFSQEVCPLPIILHRIPDSAPLVMMPKINTNLGAPNVILIDYDGEDSLTDPAWEMVNKKIEGASMSIEEALISFNITKEDYSAFNINVTTDEDVYYAANIDHRMRVFVTATSDFYPVNAGGVAYIQSFTWGSNTSAFVFSNRLGNYGKYVGECISHESGHTLGLQHQSRWVNNVKTETYHSGTGVLGTDIHHSPIMGVSYYGRHTTWWVGTTSGGTAQNDVQVITSTLNGIVFRNLTVGILRPNLTTTSTFTLDKASLVNVRVRSGDNTDIKIKVGSFENNIPDSLDARLENLTLPAGVHTLEVMPVINPNNPTGVGNFGQFFVRYEITTLSTVSLDTTTRYVRIRTADFKYTRQTIYFKPSMRDNYRIVNMAGQRMKAGILRVGMNEINISNLPAGVYVFATEFTNHKIVLY